MDQAAIIRNLRISTGLSRVDFCKTYHIPYRTMSEWERGGRHAPDYVVRLLEYAVRLDLLRKGGKDMSAMRRKTEAKASEPSKEIFEAAGTGTAADADGTAGAASPAAAAPGNREPAEEPYGKGKKTYDGWMSEEGMPPEAFHETQYIYGSSAEKQGGYTIDDYFALPDDRRAELIDGVFYDMATPAIIHQGIVGEFYHQLRTLMEKKKCPCIPLISPVGVQLDRDNRTVVEPDVLILCDQEKLQQRVVYGAPDFVAEVLSPSTRRKDMTLKLFKYSNAGVREYWMIDPKGKKVIVYDLEHEAVPVIHGMNESIPIGISDGKCEIDFAAMMDVVGFMEK